MFAKDGKTCKDCKYFENTDPQPDQFHCFRFPPARDGGRPEIRPTTRACGEFK